MYIKRPLKNLIKTILISLVEIWQQLSFIRNLTGIPQCRFYPSCSNYFIEAIKKQGLFKGFFLFLKRFSKCHPLSDGGIDHVPKNYSP